MVQLFSLKNTFIPPVKGNAKQIGYERWPRKWIVSRNVGNNLRACLLCGLHF